MQAHEIWQVPVSYTHLDVYKRQEEYLSAACANLEKVFGIKTTFQRLSTGEVQAKIEEENGNPSADVSTDTVPEAQKRNVKTVQFFPAFLLTKRFRPGTIEKTN